MPPKKAAAAAVDGDAPAPKRGGGLTKPLTLSTELAAIISKEKGEKISRAECVKRLWAYLKEHNLQDPANKQFFTPDELMQPVFGSEKIRAFSMSKFLKEHLS